MSVHDSIGYRERKRVFEFVAIIFTTLLLIGLSRLEIRLFELSESLAKNQEFFTTVIYYGLINVNVILILVLSFLIFRNVAKLVVERRRGVLGSRLRAKLVVALVFFALAPTILLFYVSTRYITRSFDEWFSEKVRATMQQTREAGAMVYRQDQRRLESLARIALQRLKVEIPEGEFLLEQAWIKPQSLKGFDKEYGVDAVSVFDAQGSLLWSSLERDGREISFQFVQDALQRFRDEPGIISRSTVEEEAGQDVVKGVAPVYDPATRVLLGVVMTETRFETQILKSIETIQTSFAKVRPGAQLIKLSYIILMVVMALLIIFCAVWLGFYVARGITGPIQSLAEATREVALGNYKISLSARTDDEVSQLVRSFNLMTRDLQGHKLAAEKSRAVLQHTNIELEERRRYMEVILKNISAGVVSVDASSKVTSFNSAAERLLQISAKDALGNPIEGVLGSGLHGEFWKPIAEKLDIGRSFSAQIEVQVGASTLNILADATRIFDEQNRDLGIVLVFDDATEQVKAQRVAAWREVARRIAHEIKNPITPIKLSAQRLLRRFHGQFTGEERQVFETCVETILKQVDSLRDLVNEFSKFARLPSIQPRMGDINEVILEIVGLFKMSYGHVEFDVSKLSRVPQLPLDKDQISRVFVNLVTNSVAAIDPKASGRIEFRTFFLDDVNAVRVEIADNGCGIPDDIRERVVEPYFSTKEEGTGLGLAIVSQIVTDHGGYLRISPNRPIGTRIVIELPTGVGQVRRA